MPEGYVLDPPPENLKSNAAPTTSKLRKIRGNEVIVLDSEQHQKPRYAIWVFLFLQIIFIRMNWWGYNAYYMQPKHNHHSVFWNPISRWLVLTLPWVGIIGLVITSFFFTKYAVLFTALTGFWRLLTGYRSYKSMQHP